MFQLDKSNVVLKTVGVICLVVVTACLVWLAFWHNTKAPVWQPVAPEDQPVAVFIGDSYTQGAGKWPGEVAQTQGWQMVNLAKGGTGYAARLTGSRAAKGCGLDECPNFAEVADAAIKRKPDVVIVAGGRNDGGRDIAQAAHSQFKKLRAGLPEARIIAVQPMWDSSPFPAFLVGYGKIIKKEVEAVDGEYVKIGSPLAGHPELIRGDGVHPTGEGQRVLGRAVNEALGRA